MTLQCCDNLKYHRLITANALLQNRVHRCDQMGLYSQDATRLHSTPKGNSVYSSKNRTAFTAQLHSNLTFRGPCIVMYSYNKSQQDALFLNFILVKNSTCFYPRWIENVEIKSKIYSGNSQLRSTQRHCVNIYQREHKSHPGGSRSMILACLYALVTGHAIRIFAVEIHLCSSVKDGFRSNYFQEMLGLLDKFVSTCHDNSSEV
jgi:hypothetical protein